ncbi:hypothetical protein GH733_003014 [Mirounga leonina]|nr:hypothetical protein GH733_003014 [Mirounga leonina]
MPGLTTASPTPSDSQEKKPLKPCCACPETKKARDAWSLSSSDPCSTSLPITIMRAYLLLMCLMFTLLDNKYIMFYSIIEKGEEQCGHLIEAHKECMRALGFKI